MYDWKAYKTTGEQRRKNNIDWSIWAAIKKFDEVEKVDLVKGEHLK